MSEEAGGRVAVRQYPLGFPEAVQKIIDGAKMTRISWYDVSIHILLEGGFLKIRKADGLHVLIVSEADMLAMDWIEVPEQAVTS